MATPRKRAPSKDGDTSPKNKPHIKVPSSNRNTPRTVADSKLLQQTVADSKGVSASSASVLSGHAERHGNVSGKSMNESNGIVSGKTINGFPSARTSPRTMKDGGAHMYIYFYIYIHVVNIYIYIYIHTHTSIYIYIYVYIYIYHGYVYIYV